MLRQFTHVPKWPTIGLSNPATMLVFSQYQTLQQNGLLLSFSYVCPEPVLGKSSVLYINGSKRPFCYLPFPSTPVRNGAVSSTSSLYARKHFVPCR